MDALKWAASVIGIILLVVLASVVLVYGPIWTIMALNLLFGLSIQVNFYTWLSALWLMVIVGGK